MKPENALNTAKKTVSQYKASQEVVASTDKRLASTLYSRIISNAEKLVTKLEQQSNQPPKK